MGASEQVSQIASDYLAIRLWSAPATLGLYVFIGWFIGQQNTRLPLVILVTATSLNAILDYIMVYHFGLHAKGIAWATLIAEYTALLLAVICWLRYYPRQSIAMAQFFIGLKSLVRTNQFLFFRTLTLLLVFAFFTSQGARMGDEILAVNALLLTLLMLISNALDGFAHAAESLCGKYFAQNNKSKLNQAMLNTAQWSVLAALSFSIILYSQGEFIITLLTNQASLIETFTRYIPLLVFLPLVAVAGYWLDGVFIGLTLVKPMQNTMIIAALFVFLPLWLLLNQYGNTGLWLAFYGFMLSRGILMGWVLLKINKK
jgi:MATE family multidrug resistance protein